MAFEFRTTQFGKHYDIVLLAPTQRREESRGAIVLEPLQLHLLPCRNRCLRHLSLLIYSWASKTATVTTAPVHRTPPNLMVSSGNVVKKVCQWLSSKSPCNYVLFRKFLVPREGAGVTPGLRRRRERAERHKSFMREQQEAAATGQRYNPDESDQGA